VSAGIAEEPKAPLFRAADGKRKLLTDSAYRAPSMRQMMKRRLEDAGLPGLFSPHSFRVTVVTDLLNQNVPLEDVQYLAGHASPTTTRVYDRAPAQGHPEYRRANSHLSQKCRLANRFR
jgi:integrase/recombinase XerD